MKFKALACGLIIGAFAIGGANLGGEKKHAAGGGAAGEEKKPKEESDDVPRLLELDVTEPGGPPWKSHLVPGRIVQVSVFCKKWPDVDLRTLKVEQMGTSARQVGGVQEVNVWKDVSKANIDLTKRHLCVFFIADRPGDTTLRITPVGKDGKERPVREIILHVFIPRPDSELKNPKLKKFGSQER